MGLGPSSKETTLHHFNDPLVDTISNDKEIDFPAVIVVGIPEVYNHKRFLAERTGMLLEAMRIDGAIVSIDSWGNSHIDFTSVIEIVAKRGIPVVGLSFMGQQASLVVRNKYLDTILDINKNEEGVETTVLGENTIVEMEAIKALFILKNKIKAKLPIIHSCLVSEEKIRQLIIKSFDIDKVILANKTEIRGKTLYINKAIVKRIGQYKEISDIKINIIYPDNHRVFVNSILDFSPIATKVFGKAGEGITHKIRGVKVMLTGVESSGFQPANIGSSEGILNEKVIFNRRGTPFQDDIIIHIDVIFTDGGARKRDGIISAHMACDKIIQEIRKSLKAINIALVTEENQYYDFIRRGGRKVVLVKLVSGLGCMYDTGLFPEEPGGYIGCRSIMDLGNMQVVISPNEYRDGVIRSLS